MTRSDCCPAPRKEQTVADNPSSAGLAEGKRLVIIGVGSAAFSAALKAADLGAHATIIKDGPPMGGNCVNVGCVPSKTLIRAADALHRAAHPPAFAGIETSGRLLDFKAVIVQKRALVHESRQTKYVAVIRDNERITFVKGRARLVDVQTVATNYLTLKADAILIATGASPSLPPIPGLESINYPTNENAFELEALPESLLVIGGRYIALECAQMFARLGSRVTVLQRSDRILPGKAPDLTDAMTGLLREEGLEIVVGVSICRVTQDAGGVLIDADVQGERRTVRAGHLLVATGRAPNVENMGLEAVGVKTNAHRGIAVGQTLQTNVPGIYAAGDMLGENQFIYAAAYEGALAVEDVLTGARKQSDYAALPWVIFTDPQLAGAA